VAMQKVRGFDSLALFQCKKSVGLSSLTLYQCKKSTGRASLTLCQCKKSAGLASLVLFLTDRDREVRFKILKSRNDKLKVKNGQIWV